MDEIRVRDAIIEEIFSQRGTTFVKIRYRTGPRQTTQRVTLVVNRDTRISDEQGRQIPAGDLEVDMVIDAAFSQVMTRSLPPQSQAFRIRVRNRPRRFDVTFGRVLQTNTANQSVLVIRTQNPASIIQFNITPETRILGPFGRTIPLSGLIPGFRVRVEHAIFMTASIPPQSTAFVIQVVR